MDDLMMAVGATPMRWPKDQASEPESSSKVSDGMKPPDGNLPFGWARLLAVVQLIRGHLQLPRLRVPGRPFLYSPLRMILA